MDCGNACRLLCCLKPPTNNSNNTDLCKIEQNLIEIFKKLENLEKKSEIIKIHPIGINKDIDSFNHNKQAKRVTICENFEENLVNLKNLF